MPKARPLEEYHEDMGDVLWWKFPVDEPPYCGTPNDTGYVVEIMASTAAYGTETMTKMVGGWPGYHTHWTPLEVPNEPSDE